MERVEWIVFCDFDGTITEEETLEKFFQNFYEEDVREVAERMLSNGYSVKKGIREMMSHVPSDAYVKCISSMKGAKIRPGFQEFLTYLRQRNIMFVIVSGGLRDMIEAVLCDVISDIKYIYSADVSLNKEYTELYSIYESDWELVSKVDIMQQFDYGKSICIGDSYTDIIIAENSHMVFARDRLKQAMEQKRKKYYCYDTFFDIIKILIESGV